MGAGSPVTTTTWGRRPLRLRVGFRASLRAFWARSLRRVHLQEMTACRIGCGCTAARRVAWLYQQTRPRVCPIRERELGQWGFISSFRVGLW